MQSLRRAFVLLSLSVALCGCASKAEDEPIWVGCVATFSGPDKAAGDHLKQGVELAVDDAVESARGRPSSRRRDHGRPRPGRNGPGRGGAVAGRESCHRVDRRGGPRPRLYSRPHGAVPMARRPSCRPSTPGRLRETPSSAWACGLVGAARSLPAMHRVEARVGQPHPYVAPPYSRMAATPSPSNWRPPSSRIGRATRGRRFVRRRFAPTRSCRNRWCACRRRSLMLC